MAYTFYGSFCKCKKRKKNKKERNEETKPNFEVAHLRNAEKQFC